MITMFSFWGSPATQKLQQLQARRNKHSKKTNKLYKNGRKLLSLKHLIKSKIFRLRSDIHLYVLYRWMLQAIHTDTCLHWNCQHVLCKGANQQVSEQHIHSNNHWTPCSVVMSCTYLPPGCLSLIKFFIRPLILPWFSYHCTFTKGSDYLLTDSFFILQSSLYGTSTVLSTIIFSIKLQRSQTILVR